MVVAFLSVLLSSTAALKEIAFMLTARILVDCFITTKIIIPASVGLTGALTFWPRVFKETGSGGGGGNGNSGRGSGNGGVSAGEDDDALPFHEDVDELAPHIARGAIKGAINT
jgi:uncharacterized membrane protein YgcG